MTTKNCIVCASSFTSPDNRSSSEEYSNIVKFFMQGFFQYPLISSQDFATGYDKTVAQKKLENLPDAVPFCSFCVVILQEGRGLRRLLSQVRTKLIGIRATIEKKVVQSYPLNPETVVDPDKLIYALVRRKIHGETCRRVPESNPEVYMDVAQQSRTDQFQSTSISPLQLPLPSSPMSQNSAQSPIVIDAEPQLQLQPQPQQPQVTEIETLDLEPEPERPWNISRQNASVSFNSLNSNRNSFNMESQEQEQGFSVGDASSPVIISAYSLNANPNQSLSQDRSPLMSSTFNPASASTLGCSQLSTASQNIYRCVRCNKCFNAEAVLLGHIQDCLVPGTGLVLPSSGASVNVIRPSPPSYKSTSNSGVVSRRSSPYLEQALFAKRPCPSIYGYYAPIQMDNAPSVGQISRGRSSSRAVTGFTSTSTSSQKDPSAVAEPLLITLDDDENQSQSQNDSSVNNNNINEEGVPPAETATLLPRPPTTFAYVPPSISPISQSLSITLPGMSTSTSTETESTSTTSNTQTQNLTFHAFVPSSFNPSVSSSTQNTDTDSQNTQNSTHSTSTINTASTSTQNEAISTSATTIIGSNPDTSNSKTSNPILEHPANPEDRPQQPRSQKSKGDHDELINSEDDERLNKAFDALFEASLGMPDNHTPDSLLELLMRS